MEELINAINHIFIRQTDKHRPDATESGTHTLLGRYTKQSIEHPSDKDDTTRPPQHPNRHQLSEQDKTLLYRGHQLSEQDETLRRQIHQLSEQDETLLRRTLRTLHFPKGSVIIEKEQIDDSIYFITEGVWRAHLERDGEDFTLWFAVPGEAVFSSWGHIRGLPSRFTLSASSDSVAIEMKKSTIDRLTISSPVFLQWLHTLYVDILLNTDDQLIDLSYPKAEKRYLAFMKKMPELFQHVSLKEIAGYIGVTPQSLSRIRAGLNKNTKGA